MRLCLALFGAPAAWLAQMTLSQGLAAYACYPHQAPLWQPQWQILPVLMAVISIGCLAVAVLSGVAALAIWNDAKQEKPGAGRARFIAALAIMSSLLFLIAIIFTGCAVVFVSPCRPWL
jgi:hypothetical protein